MKTDSIKKNFFYQIIYQVVTMIYPLITYPYISRVFGPTGLGAYSFTNSVIFYFLIISNLGIVNYGSRETAKYVNDKEKLGKNFWGIFICHVISSIIAILIYIVYLFVFNNKYTMLSLCQMFQLIAVIFDISWFFSGIQKLRSTSMINTLIKIVSVILTFILVKSEKDIYIYVLILSFGNLIGHLLLFLQLRKYIQIKNFKNINIKKHIKPLIILCIPIVAISLYKYMDKIMIELMSTTYQLGLYEAAEKIITVPLGVITALGLVMLPKMSQLVSDGLKNKSIELLKITMNYSMMLAIGMFFGIMAITPTLVPIFLGDAFIKSDNLIIMLSISILFTTWANMIRAQYLIPNNKDKEFIISVFGGALINLILNIILIPKLYALGAVIGTVFAEATVAIIHSIYSHKELNIFEYIKNIIFYIFPGTIMLLVVRGLNYFMTQSVVSLIIQIVVGAMIYGIIVSIYLYYKKDKIFMNYLYKFCKIKRKREI